MKIPSPEVYGQGLAYWPYRKSLQKVLDLVVEQTPLNGTLLDLMCGPGYLLGKIAEVRSDLILKGVDLNNDYVTHARQLHSQITFETGDVCTFNPEQTFDTVLCTGALHHVSYDLQEKAIENLASLTRTNGFCIISDSYIHYYFSEGARKLAAARLGYEYLKATLERRAPLEVIEDTINILRNDVVGEEFKTSITSREQIFRKYFAKVETTRTWPPKSRGYGDYISILRKS
jgi:SAM-dependent methyltransferase